MTLASPAQYINFMIDTHSHIFDDKIYKAYFIKAKHRIRKVLVINWHKNNLEKFVDFVNSKKNLYAVASIDIDKNIPEQLEICDKLFREKKIFGIKLYPGYQYFYPSDEKIYSTAELCQKHNKPLIFHSGDVWDPDNKAVLEYSRSIYIDKLAVNFPKCKIIIAHFGFPYFLETANVVSKNENVYTDISGTLDKQDTKKEEKTALNQYVLDLKRAFSYFPDVKKKVMFGTDFCGEDTPLHEIDLYIKVVKKVFTKDEQKNVFVDLAEKLFFE